MKTIKKIPCTPNGKGKMHDWDTLLDGKCRELTAGIDFYCEMRSMRATIYAVARKRGLRAITRENGNVLYVQAQRDSAT